MTQKYKNIGYGTGLCNSDDLRLILAEVTQIEEFGANQYPLAASYDAIESLLTEYLIDYNNFFDYPNKVEVLTETRPLKMESAVVTNVMCHGSGHSVMRAIIFLESGNMDLDYVDSTGRIRTQILACEQGTIVIFPSILNHRVNDTARVYADFIFDLNAEFDDGGYILKRREAPLKISATK